MAFVGVGCRAPTAIFRRPASYMMLLPSGVAVKFGERRTLFSSGSRSPWKTHSRVQFLGDTRGFVAEWRGGPVIKTLPERYFVKAVDVSGPGAVDSPLMQSMQSKIKENLNAEIVSVTDAYGDGRHVSIDVVASAFEGKSAVNRQRLVYNAIWEELQDKVHAVDQLKTRTPTEASKSADQL